MKTLLDAASKEALLVRFNKRWTPVPESGCWLWASYCDKKGYGRFDVKGFEVHLAHRASYIFHRGEIPEGMQLDHLCRVRCCVNPWHLEIVTATENSLRAAKWNTHYASKTHCKRGHPYSGENLYLKGKWRICRACSVIYRRAWNQKQRDKLAIVRHGGDK